MSQHNTHSFPATSTSLSSTPCKALLQSPNLTTKAEKCSLFQKSIKIIINFQQNPQHPKQTYWLDPSSLKDGQLDLASIIGQISEQNKLFGSGISEKLILYFNDNYKAFVYVGKAPLSSPTLISIFHLPVSIDDGCYELQIRIKEPKSNLPVRNVWKCISKTEKSTYSSDTFSQMNVTEPPSDEPSYHTLYKMKGMKVGMMLKLILEWQKKLKIWNMTAASEYEENQFDEKQATRVLQYWLQYVREGKRLGFQFQECQNRTIEYLRTFVLREKGKEKQKFCKAGWEFVQDVNTCSALGSKKFFKSGN